MKEKPILFSTPMVQSILDGRKTQTRRIIKQQPDARGLRTTNVMWEDWHGREVECPYGQPGDILWVRETWRKNLWPTGWPFEYRATAEIDMNPTDGTWKPSIHMPREACRIRLKIIDIRAERLQDISEEDAIAEGISLPNYAEQSIKDVCYPEPSAIYADLWESINGKGSWGKNPWVWVVEFRRITG